MNSGLRIFDFENHPVRIFDRYNQPWFVAADVCAVLELSNPSMAIEKLDDDERAKECLGRQGETNLVSESGLYALIFKSRKAKARIFRKWVTGEVLPALRRDGHFEMSGTHANENEEIKSMVLITLRGLMLGTMDTERGQAILTGARVWNMLEARCRQSARVEGHVLSSDIAAEVLSEWAVVVGAMAEGDLSRTWTAGALRDLALQRGCFANWLTRASAATAAVRSRFGKVCSAMSGRTFGGFRFIVDGKNRDRRYRIKRIVEVQSLNEEVAR